MRAYGVLLPNRKELPSKNSSRRDAFRPSTLDLALALDQEGMHPLDVKPTRSGFSFFSIPLFCAETNLSEDSAFLRRRVSCGRGGKRTRSEKTREEGTERSELHVRLSTRRSAPVLTSENDSVRVSKANMSPGVDGFNDNDQASSLSCGPSIRAVLPGVHPRIGSADSDSACPHEDFEIYRGEVRKRARAEILGVLPEETHPDQNNQYTNPLAPNMGAPVHETKGASSKDVSPNPLSRAFGNISKWPRGSFEETGSERATQNGQAEDMGPTDASIHGSPQTRSKDCGAYKPSVPSKLRSESTEVPIKCTGKGSKSEHRGVLGSSSSDSPTIDTVSGGFATHLERMSLLDEERLPKLVDAPWPLSKSKRGSVRQIAAKFEGIDRDSTTPAGARYSLSEDQPKASISGSRNSVSCPVGGNRGSRQAWPYGSLEDADDPFISEAGRESKSANNGGSKKDQSDDRAWERLTAALGHMPPGDLALLQELLVVQSQGEAATGAAGRQSIDAGRLGGVTGEK